MPNVKQLLDGHSKAILEQDEEKKYNYRKKEECPLNEECLVDEVVYQATVKTQATNETYIGLTASQFKTRYNNHRMSFRHEKRRKETELSKHLWKLKDANKTLTITWTILAKAKAYTNLTKRCNLCNTEKFFLITKPHMASLNRRNELFRLAGIDVSLFLDTVKRSTGQSLYTLRDIVFIFILTVFIKRSYC